MNAASVSTIRLRLKTLKILAVRNLWLEVCVWCLCPLTEVLTDAQIWDVESWSVYCISYATEKKL